jgi:hypothetical protein
MVMYGDHAGRASDSLDQRVDEQPPRNLAAQCHDAVANGHLEACRIQIELAGQHVLNETPLDREPVSRADALG